MLRNRTKEKMKYYDQVLEKFVYTYESRIKRLEDVVFALKEDVKSKKQEESLSQKKKWLTGYPDETGTGKD